MDKNVQMESVDIVKPHMENHYCFKLIPRGTYTKDNLNRLVFQNYLIHWSDCKYLKKRYSGHLHNLKNENYNGTTLS